VLWRVPFSLSNKYHRRGSLGLLRKSETMLDVVYSQNIANCVVINVGT